MSVCLFVCVYIQSCMWVSVCAYCLYLCVCVCHLSVCPYVFDTVCMYVHTPVYCRLKVGMFCVYTGLSVCLSVCLSQSFSFTTTQVVNFSLIQVAVFIAVLCGMAVIAQTLILAILIAIFGHKYTIIIGLIIQAIQLFIYGVWTAKW